MISTNYAIMNYTPQYKTAFNGKGKKLAERVVESKIPEHIIEGGSIKGSGIHTPISDFLIKLVNKTENFILKLVNFK